MGTKQTLSLTVVADNATGERKVVLHSENAESAFFFNLEELRGLKVAINGAIEYLEEHGTTITESVPVGAVRH